jgi:RND superfamily putative drug exporter
LPERCLSVQGHRLLQEAFPKAVFGSKVIFTFERADQPLTPADLALVDRAVNTLQRIERESPGFGLGTISSHHDPLIGGRLLSADRRCTLVMVAMQSPFLAVKTADAVKHCEAQVTPLVEEYRRGGSEAGTLKFATTGPSGIGRDLNEAAYRSLDDTTLATFVLVVIILLLVYRSPLLAFVPLVTIGVSVWISLRILAVLTLIPEFQLVNIARIFIVVVLYGAGTDYCLFLISRYREELQQGREPADAVWYSLRQVGWALTASAATVICGLGMMGFAEFAKLRYTGPAIALSLLVALAASLTLAPALLRLLGERAFWPRRLERLPPELITAQNRPTRDSRLWTWLSLKVSAYPVRTWLLAVLVLAPLAVLGYRTEYVFDVCAELPRDSQSRQGLEIIRRHFTAGEVGPLTLLLQSPQPWNSTEGRTRIAELSRELRQLPVVAEVRSLTQPLGVPRSVRSGEANRPADETALFSRLAAPLIDKVIQPYYLAPHPDGNVTRLDVILRTEPFCKESVAAMHVIRARLDQVLARQETTAPRYALYGITPMTADLAEVHESDRLLVNTLVLLGILLILLSLVRRPVVAVYLLISVLFSYYVAIGVAELLSVGWLDSQIGEVDWKVPYFLFTILVAIGEDYNIFLITRVLEESRRNGPHLGIRLALARTGPTISSCGLIMAGTFATMMLGSLVTLAQLGLALAFGVLLDTFVVRPLLVPAFLVILDRPRRSPPTLQGPHQLVRRIFQRVATQSLSESTRPRSNTPEGV